MRTKLLGLVLVLTAMSAYADEQQDCYNRAVFVKTMAEQRDKGVPEFEQMNSLEQLGKKRNDSEGIGGWKVLVHYAYNSSDKTPAQLGDGIYATCMKRAEQTVGAHN